MIVLPYVLITLYPQVCINNMLLQIVDVPERPGSSEGLEYDPEWLAILKATNSLQRITPHPWNPPENNGLHERYTDI